MKLGEGGGKGKRMCVGDKEVGMRDWGKGKGIESHKVLAPL